jgi:hypothetical protein
MTLRKKSLRTAVFAVILVVAGLAIGKVAFSRPMQTEEDAYRVELVMSDQYRVQRALNQMASKGWYYISSVPRQDGKVLLVFRKAQGS